MPGQEFAIHFGPWVWPLFASGFVMVVTWFCWDDTPTGDYGHTGQGRGNLLMLLAGMIAVLIFWLAYFAWRAYA